jgi:hypothetical protein
MSKHGDPAFDSARDELFSQINRCGVVRAAPEQQREWLRDTVQYLHEMQPTLTDAQLNDLREIGERFCQPAIPHGKGKTELNRGEWEAGAPDDGEGAEDEATEGEPAAVERAGGEAAE